MIQSNSGPTMSSRKKNRRERRRHKHQNPIDGSLNYGLIPFPHLNNSFTFQNNQQITNPFTQQSPPYMFYNSFSNGLPPQPITSVQKKKKSSKDKAIPIMKVSSLKSEEVISVQSGGPNECKEFAGKSAEEKQVKLVEGSQKVGKTAAGEESKKGKARKPKPKSATSKYRGVAWHSRDKCYVARVYINSSAKYLGSFKQELKAALAVDEAVKGMGRDTSHLNFPFAFERGIALALLKNYPVGNHHSAALKTSGSDSDNSAFNDGDSPKHKELEAQGYDRNGYPNCIYSAVEKLVDSMNAGKRKANLGHVGVKRSRIAPYNAMVAN